MKRCYNCKGKIIKEVGSVIIEGIKIEDIPYKVCQQCKERYYDENTAQFIQKITNFVKEQRHKLLTKQFNK